MSSATPEKPWVAFCISTYKRTTFLAKQLYSLKLQTYTNFEVIISDNDPEKSGEVVVKAINDNRFRYFPNGQDLGMVKSFNLSIERAEAEYVVMLTDDDFLNIEMLQILKNLSIAYPGYGMYFGGNNRFYSTTDSAKLSNAKVGDNSQLADFDIDTIRIFSAEIFSLAYFTDDFGGGIFWSTGIVKRDIIKEIGGLPDYGSPNMIDCAYVLLSGSKQGAVFINTSLGSQNIHQNNFSFKKANYEHFNKGVIGFYECVKSNIPKTIYTTEFDKRLKTYIARNTLTLLIFSKKNLRKTNQYNESFSNCIKDIFKISFMKKWRVKYIIAVHTPFLFRQIINIKNKFL